MIRQSLFALVLLASPMTVLAQGGTSSSPPSSLQDAETQRYVSFATAMALDDRCHYLRNLERMRVYPVQEALLEDLHFHQAYQSTKISQEEYAAELDALAERGAEAAAGINCTDSAKASPLILPLRAEIAPNIYSDLLIAFEHGNLTAEQQNAARAFEAMIFPLYGQANWENFVRYAAAEAGKRIEQARADDAVDDVYGFSLFGPTTTLGYGVYFDDDAADLFPAGTANFDGLVQNTVETVNAILFEATAEQFGYRWIMRQAPHSFASRQQLTDIAFNPVTDIWRQPEQYGTLDSGAKFHAIFTLASNGDVRVMTYGQGASALSGGKVVVLVHEKLPEDMTDSFAYSRSAEWWTNAQRFEARSTEQDCLGGPCFALPPEAVDAIDATGAGQAYRLFFVADSAAPDPAPDDPRIISGFGYSIAYRKEMLALGL